MNRSIPVYKAERELGLAELIQSKSSVSYLVKPELDLNPNKDKISAMAFLKNHAVATNQGQIDLYYLKDILVSTGWNLNEDIFINDEVWPARNTAEDKQFNLGHNQKEIIGHMTSQYAIDTQGSILADDLDICSLPDKFHIVSSAVIYRYWPDKDQMEKINQIIAEIEEAKDDPKWFVSMECLFSNFDYGIIDSAGAQTILPRNSTSAFLTKHLRAYGGTGEYKDCKVGRVLRNITFSGKGLVENPANPESLILNDSTPFKAASASNNSTFLVDLGYTKSSEINSKENDSMATENNVLEKQLAEANATIEKERAARAEVEKKFKEEADKAAQAKVDELVKTAEAAKAKTVEVEAQLKAKADELAETNKKLADATKTLAEVNDKLTAIEKEKVALARKTELVSKLGVDEAKAVKLVETLNSLSDEAFASYVENSPKAVKAAEVVPAVKVEEKPKVDPAAAAKALDNAEPNKTEVATASETNKEVATAGAKVTEYLKKARPGRKSEADKNS